MRRSSRVRIALIAGLAALLVFGVTALVGVAAPPPGKGKAQAGVAQAQYGPAGKQYGQNKVPVCHKGKTLRLPAPAARAHMRHGDRPGAC